MAATAPVLLLVVAAFVAVATWRFVRVLRPVLAAPAAARFDRPGDRIKGVLGDVGLHRRLLMIRYSGILHLMIFWGFVILFTVTIQSFGEGVFEGFSLAPIGGNTWIAVLQEIFAVLVVFAIGMAAYQRFVIKPKRFKTSNQLDAWTIYGLVLAVVATLVLEFAFKMVATGEFNSWRPLSSAIARGIVALGVQADTAAGFEHFFWWAHIIAILTFLVYIPGSKHRHIFTAAPNIYFRALDRKQELPPVDLDQSSVGVKSIEQFNWKHKLDLISCTECGRCEAACPANAAGLPLSPKLLVTDLRDHMAEHQSGSSNLSLIGEVITEQTLWACTTCRACMDVCPVRIEPMVKIIEMRRSVVETGDIEPMLQDALANLQRTGNSQGKPPRQRARWTAELDFKIKDARTEEVDVLWFVGDFASYDQRVQRITRQVATLLHHAGVDFGILYEAEQNAGNDVRRVGEEGAFETLARQNIETLAGCSFKRIMTTDPHTLNALRNDYSSLGANYEVLHYTQLILELLDAGRVSIDRADGRGVTYHDPCYLGRYNGGFDAPREIIRRTGYTLNEMGRCRENSFCCGAGGGRVWMDDSAMTERPSENRIREALAMGTVDTFVVACPKDTVMYSAAVQALGVSDRIQVRDVIDLVAVTPRAVEAVD
ncbi:MAG: heterodisulfide reductase-related iron-sulfur binding cluster [Mesorhizobium sp.]